MITLDHIDGGAPFDWGRTSDDYAQFRDIYPPAFYQHILDKGLCTAGQIVLDLGTGTGVQPRNLYAQGAKWVAADIAENQIAAAKRLAAQAGMDIDFRACPAEAIDFPPHSFDVVTACQCIWYFDHAALAPKLARLLKPDGRFLILYMAWLPYEDQIAQASEKIILRHNPDWTGGGETRKPLVIDDAILASFDLVRHDEFDVNVPFTRESWHGRMRACRGVGASMDAPTLAKWETEHRAMLEQLAPPSFDVLHFVATAELKPKQ